jgi:DNA-directed RNA polymerase subunit M/transcription elongation factor TFIIS
MATEEIHFCGECFNLTHLQLDEDSKLIHFCKICEKTEEFSGSNNCIYSNDLKEFDVSQVINTNKYITHDKTLPSIRNNINLNCPNEECTTNTEKIDKSFKYIKYDDKNMKYMYICETCGQKWTN